MPRLITAALYRTIIYAINQLRNSSSWPSASGPGPGRASRRRHGRGGRPKEQEKAARGLAHLGGGEGGSASAALGDREDPDLGIRGTDLPDRRAVQPGARLDLNLLLQPPSGAARTMPRKLTIAGVQGDTHPAAADLIRRDHTVGAGPAQLARGPGIGARAVSVSRGSSRGQ
jgi:hypothetical protein